MPTPQITVVGSYATGLTMKVSRLPVGGETLLGSGYRVDYGGKGSNQAVACSRLGCKVNFIAKIGNDSFGESALNLYREEGIDVSHVKRTGDAPTGVGFIIVDAVTGHNCITIDPGANDLLTASDISDCKAAFSSASVVLTQLETTVEVAKAAMALGRANKAITILNPAPVRTLPAAVLQLVDVLTPNETEAKVLAGHASGADLEPEHVARELIRLGVKQVVMTLGDQGALIATSSSFERVPAINVSAVDSTGAGDAFNAGLATALAHGADLKSAVELAVITGGLAVTKEGVIPSLPDRSAVLKLSRERSLPLKIGL